MRVNVSIDKSLLYKAKKKLDLFGGKLSSLFNAYLNDFISSYEEPEYAVKKDLKQKIKELEERISKIEGKIKERVL